MRITLDRTAWQCRQSHQRRSTKWVAVGAALPLLMASCGSGQIDTQPAGQASANDAVSATSSIAERDQAADWVLAPGTWVTAALGEPLAFDVDREVRVLAEAESVVYLATPGEHKNLITIALMTGMWNGSADVPVPEELELMTTAWAANPANMVGNTGVLQGTEGSAPWWDITITERPEFVYNCWLGSNCVFNTFAGASSVHSLQGQPMRFYARNDLQLGLGVHVSGDPAGMADALEIADQIAGSLRSAPLPDAAGSSIAFLGAAGSALPPGESVVVLGDAVVRFDFSDPAPDLALYTNLGVAYMDLGPFSFEIVDPVFLDPDSDAVPLFPDRPPTGRPTVLTTKPVTNEEVVEYFEAHAEVTKTGTGTIGGLEAIWFEFGEPAPGRSYSCPDPGTGGQANCVNLVGMEMGMLSHSTGESTVRFYYLETAELIVEVRAASGTMEEALVAVEPILSGMTITVP